MTTPRDLGRPIQWGDAELEALSQVTPSDVAAAEAIWAKDAPPGLRDLLQAAPREPDA